MPTLWDRRPTPVQRTRTSSPCACAASGCAPSVKTWISARGSAPTRARAVRSPSARRFGRSCPSMDRRAEATRSCSRVNGTTTFGCTPASTTITSAPSPRRPSSPSAARWACPKREGETSVAFMDAEVSMTMTTRFAPCPITVTAGRASATVSASRARICKIRSGSRCRRWKKVEASRSRRAACQSRRLETGICRRRTFRKYRSSSGTARVPSSSANGLRKFMPAAVP